MARRSEPFKRQKINILGVKVDDLTFDDATLLILKLIDAKKKGKIVVTVNSEFIMMARRNAQFRKILNNADLALPDGQWVVNSKLIVGGKVHERITGVDIIERLCYLCAKKPIRVGFLGGFGSVADEVVKRQKKQNPQLKVVFSDAGNPSIGYDLRLKKALNAVRRIDILFVAYGMGQQEFWIERFKNKVDVGVFIGVGGAFDYLSQAKKRAPKVLQDWGLEWLWRLVNEPARIWRMRVLPAFLFLVFWQFLKNRIKNDFA